MEGAGYAGMIVEATQASFWSPCRENMFQVKKKNTKLPLLLKVGNRANDMGLAPVLCCF